MHEEHEADEHEEAPDDAREDKRQTEVEPPFLPLVSIDSSVRWHETFQFWYRVSIVLRFVPDVFEADQSEKCVKYEEDKPPRQYYGFPCPRLFDILAQFISSQLLLFFQLAHHSPP